MSDIIDILRRASESLDKAKEFILTTITTNNGSSNGSVQWDGGEGLQNFDLQGAGTEDLSQNMSGLSGALVNDPSLLQIDSWAELPPEVQENIRGIAEARGISLETAQDDYFQFVDLVNTYDIELTTASSNGSIAQLRFGFIVGDALGIDPAYASMMSPNGGLTGPGANALNLDGVGSIEDALPITDALAYHSPTHDAYGFLQHNFDVGPGYCYVPDGFCERGPENPLSGQVSGISYWTEELGINVTREEISEAYQDITGDVQNWGSDRIDDLQEGAEWVGDQAVNAGETVAETAGDIVDFLNPFD